MPQCQGSVQVLNLTIFVYESMRARVRAVSAPNGRLRLYNECWPSFQTDRIRERHFAWAESMVTPESYNRDETALRLPETQHYVTSDVEVRRHPK